VRRGLSGEGAMNRNTSGQVDCFPISGGKEGPLQAETVLLLRELRGGFPMSPIRGDWGESGSNAGDGRTRSLSSQEKKKIARCEKVATPAQSLVYTAQHWGLRPTGSSNNALRSVHLMENDGNEKGTYKFDRGTQSPRQKKVGGGHLSGGTGGFLSYGEAGN